MRLLDCVIADDEKLARDVLKNYIDRDGNCRLVDTFSDGKALQSYLLNTRVDLVLLDIQMPGIGGLDLIRSLHDRPAVILTTAFSEFAVDAFALSVTDYLLKPISFTRFRQAIEKVRDLNLKTIASDRGFIDFTVDRKKVRIPVDDILFLEAIGNYVKIHLAERFVIIYGSIQKVLTMFPASKFVQIHRSYVVNVDKVQAYSTSSVTILPNKSLPIGRNFKDTFLSERMGRS